MSIRQLLQFSNSEIIAKIFKELPVGISCFSPSISYVMTTFPFNVFDNGLAIEKFKENFDFNKFSTESHEKLFKFDDLIHVLVIRLGDNIRPMCDHRGSEFKIVEKIDKRIDPNNALLKNFGMIGNKYPIISYMTDNDPSEKCNGFVIYRNLKAIEDVIKFQAKKGHKEAKKNYSELVELAKIKIKNQS